MSQGYSVYKKTSTLGASPLQNMATLLERIANLALEAKEAILSGDIEARFLATEKGMDITTGLMNVLDHNNPETKEFAHDMDTFLKLVMVNLMEINIKNEATMCDRISNGVREMASIWRLAHKTQIESTPVADHSAPSAQPSQAYAPLVI